jgi:hypothetical protein
MMLEFPLGASRHTMQFWRQLRPYSFFGICRARRIWGLPAHRTLQGYRKGADRITELNEGRGAAHPGSAGVVHHRRPQHARGETV